MNAGELPRHVVVVGALIRNPAGDVLLIRHPRRGWEIPQGKVEEGESLADALDREIMEEAGVRITNAVLAAVYSKMSTPPALILAFVADHLDGEPRVSEESLEVAWFTPQEALAKVSHPVNRHRLQDLLAFAGAIRFRAYQPTPYAVLQDLPI